VQDTHSIAKHFPWSFLFTLKAVWTNCKRRHLLQIAAAIAAFPLVITILVLFYINLGRSDLPDLDAFIRFEPPTIGHVYDAQGQVLLELARERRQVIQYKDIPEVVRQAILSAEDENFFSHSGVDYSVFLRVLAKSNPRAIFSRHKTSIGGAPPQSASLCFPKAARPSPSS